MAVLRISSLVIIIVTVYVVNVESQSDTNKQTTSLESTNVAVKGNLGNPKAQALTTNTQADPAKNPAKNKSKIRIPPKRRKIKRRPRKRRPPPRKMEKTRLVKNNHGKVKAPNTVPAAKQVKAATKIVIEPKDALVLNSAETVVKVKTAPLKTAAKVKVTPLKAESKAKAAPLKANANAKAEPVKTTVKVKAKPEKTVVETKAASNMDGFGQDPFFDLFAETTTVGPDPYAPPPDFSINKIPAKKVIPKVDPRKSKAYDGTPCNETYKNHATDKTKYKMKYADGGWETLDCPPNYGSGLVWRQDLCSCGIELVPVDPNDWCAAMGFSSHKEKRHKYVRKDQGVNVVMDCAASLVWSQEKCLCMYDPVVIDRPIENQVTFVCKTILQMEFEGNLQNKAQGYHIQPVKLRRRGIPRIQYRKVPGAVKKAALIVSQPLEFLAFRGNDFQKQVTYALSFKISPRHRNKDNFMVLLTDECIANPGRQNEARKPGIKLAFQPNTKTFNLQFRTKKTDVDQLIKGAKADTYGWYKVVVYFEDNTLSMEVNGQKVFTQTDVMGKIPQNECPLYIAGRGRGYSRAEDFYGYLDNVNLVKDCKFHEANIKFL
ncbi:uncharacterized protein LOC123529301 [Mercenaria mercenaria]|uniref:uncharacterized protein LOC123529301 n=1 Tax=Mercenaria mercenaria TaxID=6596 RepID=UPI00234EAE80|nr:uncharacterized protein LOC123529301 [Mercenaria mercenaria]